MYGIPESLLHWFVTYHSDPIETKKMPNKLKICRMTKGRCVLERRCAGDGPLTYIEEP